MKKIKVTYRVTFKICDLWPHHHIKDIQIVISGQFHTLAMSFLCVYLLGIVFTGQAIEVQLLMNIAAFNAFCG